MGKYHCQKCYQWVDELCYWGLNDFTYNTSLSIHKVYFTGKIVDGKPYGKGTLTIDEDLWVQEYKGNFKGDYLEGTYKTWLDDDDKEVTIQEDGRISLGNLEFTDSEWKVSECTEKRREKEKING